MRRPQRRRHALGRDPADWPTRRSNVRLARLDNGEQMGGECCFPHGLETTNPTWRTVQRCWKRHQRTQWRERGREPGPGVAQAQEGEPVAVGAAAYRPGRGRDYPPSSSSWRC